MSEKAFRTQESARKDLSACWKWFQNVGEGVRTESQIPLDLLLSTTHKLTMDLWTQQKSCLRRFDGKIDAKIGGNHSWGHLNWLQSNVWMLIHQQARSLLVHRLVYLLFNLSLSQWKIGLFAGERGSTPRQGTYFWSCLEGPLSSELGRALSPLFFFFWLSVTHSSPSACTLCQQGRPAGFVLVRVPLCADSPFFCCLYPLYAPLSLFIGFLNLPGTLWGSSDHAFKSKKPSWLWVKLSSLSPPAFPSYLLFLPSHSLTVSFRGYCRQHGKILTPLLGPNASTRETRHLQAFSLFRPSVSYAIVLIWSYSFQIQHSSKVSQFFISI